MQKYFGLFEALFFFGLVFAFYLWEMRRLDRDIAARKAKEAEEADRQEKT